MQGGDKRAYAAPTIRAIDPHEVIRKLMAQLTGPLGATREERAINAADQIRGVLERLPADERDDAIRGAIGPDSRWILQAKW
jgi:hypothetical protein